MFFPERIKSIKETDKILEIGPGSSPFPRSDVFLDKKFDDKEGLKQRGLQPKIEYDKPIYYYDNAKFPFQDTEFHYVICSQVLEHVPANEFGNFIKEVERVAKQGYIEVPRLFYEYLFNFHEHKWLINFKDGKLLLLDKRKVEFSHIQDAFYLMLRYGGKKKEITLINDFVDFFMIGYEWKDKINYEIVDSLDELTSSEDVNHYKDYFTRLNEKNTDVYGRKSLIERVLLKTQNILKYLKRRGKILETIGKLRKSGFYVNFNQRNRDEWVKKIASQIPENSEVLDVGAGTCRYRELFHHCKYFTQDFQQAEGAYNGEFKYGHIDYTSDITEIPVPDESFDAILCTEVLEHVAQPIKALKEFSRILKHRGQLYITAPLGCGLHMMPYHYYGGFTPSFYKKYFEEFGIKLISIEPNGGLLKHFLQESDKVGGQLLGYKKYSRFSIRGLIIRFVFLRFIPAYLYDLDDKLFIEDFTIGYHVRGEKK